MAERVCPQCGAPIDPQASECRFCGEKLVVQQVANQAAAQPQFAQQPYQQQYAQPPQQQIIIQQTAAPQPTYVSGINPAWPIKNKMVAGLLAIFLGGAWHPQILLRENPYRHPVPGVLLDIRAGHNRLYRGNHLSVFQ